MNKFPVTILTGYLGAGKTTLLKSLLDYAKENGPRIAILMNEFGEIDVDAKIIKSSNFDLVELAGGCVCCSLTGEFNAALLELASMKNPPEHVIVETTGLAEPDAIIVDLQEAIDVARLDSVVTLVDCDAFTKYPSLGHTGRVQIEMADLLILSKADLVDKSIIADISEKLREINDRALIAVSENGKVSPQLILANRSDKVAGVDKSKINRNHLQQIQSFVVPLEQPLMEERFNEFVYGIDSSIYRAKGFVKLTDGRIILFNYVAGRADSEEWQDQIDNSYIVFISTQNITEEIKINLEEGLAACIED